MYEYEKPYDIRCHRKIITMGYTLLKNSSVDWNCPKSLISFQYIFIFQENMVQLVDLARCVWLILACGLTIKVDIILVALPK